MPSLASMRMRWNRAEGANVLGLQPVGVPGPGEQGVDDLGRAGVAPASIAAYRPR